ncbi:hypothetical protein M426DRAFT_7956 [Hypoxylon sp. CI-4A]|nr:hypothetical protein M426DRAFT_7956 [Hypoxylon sp. CI-4A]
MVARRAITTSGCAHCRSAILKLFTSPPNPLPAVRTGSLQYRPRIITTAPVKSFSSQSVLRESSNNPKSTEQHQEEEDNVLDDQENDDTSKDSNSGNIPWYLQVEPPRHVVSIEPPPLPEAPSGSPEIVGSLLEYVSEELGLDELSLLDLRELDPPAALGPNLFMLFGTARSERHLNVSAGRLLRWLRAKHRVYAHADGLLGPNERKTKLRRKAKRAKLLGGVEDIDDGIKTGWICVNLGTIGRGKEEAAVVAEDGRVAGFGVAQSGTTIIVQIMTEFRRAEMGLETLWKKALGEPIEDAPKLEEEKVETSDNLHPLERAILSNSHPTGTSRKGHFNDTSRRTPFEQTRFYSTQQAVTNQVSEFGQLFHVHTKEDLERVLKSDFHQKRRILELLRIRLEELPAKSSRRSVLGALDTQQEPTSFLRLSQLACQSLPPDQTWEFRLAIHSMTCDYSSHNAVETLTDVKQLVEEMGIYGIQPTREQCMQLLRCIYRSDIGGIKEQTKLALQLLKTLQQRGQPVLANDVIVTIIEVAARYAERGKNPEYLELIKRLEDVLLQAGLPCMEEPLLMRLMTTYLRLRNWDGFWNTWRTPPRYLRPRSAAMYIHAYNLATATKSRPVCVMIIRRCFQEMLSEEPTVAPTGAVLKALMECIRVADPHAEENAQSVAAGSAIPGSRLRSEFVKLIRSIQMLDRI